MLKALLVSTIFIFAISCNVQKGKRSDNNPIVHSTPLADSLEVLTRSGAFVAGIAEPPSPEEKRYMHIIESLDTLPFSILDSLIFDKNHLKKLYAFTIALHKYYDSLSPKHYASLEDTTAVIFFPPEKKMEEKITVKELAYAIKSSVDQDKEIDKREPEIRDAVRSFIKNYSSHSNSYVPVSFNRWGWGGSEPDKAEYFQIEHSYQIMNNDKKNVTATHFFVFTDKMKISVIKNERDGTIMSIPPKISDWLLQYGRKLSPTDSIALRFK
jgi:hypothetical protein